MNLIFLVAALVLAVIELAKTRLNSLLGWAVLSIAISLLFPMMR